MSFFNVDEQEKTEPQYKLHPMGVFKATITKVVEKEAKSGTNRFVMLFMETSEGKINDVINYQNANKDVEKRALSTLADACFACGEKKSFKNAEELLEHCEGKDIYIRVYHTKPREGFNQESKVGEYYNLKKEIRSGVVPKVVKVEEGDIPF